MELEHTNHVRLDSPSDCGKGNPTEDIEEVGEREGYLLDRNAARDQGWQTASDGHTILIPQPSSSPQDPLNWSTFKKHVILIIVSCTALLPDYGSATGAVTLIPQSKYVASYLMCRVGIDTDWYG